jgi:hypothetical protein
LIDKIHEIEVSDVSPHHHSDSTTWPVRCNLIQLKQAVWSALRLTVTSSEFSGFFLIAAGFLAGAEAVLSSHLT